MTAFIIDFECTDETGRYISPVICERRGDRFVAHYIDFPDIVQICHANAKMWVLKNMLRYLFSQEGVIPRVKYLRSEPIEMEKSPLFRAGQVSLST